MAKSTAKTIAVISDLHFPHVHRPTWKAFRRWHAIQRPATTVVLGDFLDLASLSSFTQDPNEPQQIIPQVKEWVNVANSLRNECGKLIIVEGNHEWRVAKKVLEPVAFQMLGAIGLTLREQCYLQGLHKAVEWHTESLDWKGLKMGQFLLRHGHKQSSRFGGGANVARSALQKSLGKSQVFGHYHQIQMIAHGTDHLGTSIAIANGHMEDNVEFSLENNWARGFTVLELDEERDWCSPYPVIIEKGRFAWKGQIYDGNDKNPTLPPPSQVRIKHGSRHRFRKKSTKKAVKKQRSWDET